MRYSISALAVGTLALGASALPVAEVADASRVGVTPKALYFITNDPGVANNLIAVSVDKNGKAGSTTRTPTGGLGGVMLQSDGKELVTVDSLATQDAVVVSDNYVYAINPGSNSFSTFKINPSNPTDVTLVEPPTQLHGEFPATIAVAPRNNLVCAGTQGAVNGFECFKAGKNGKLTPDGNGFTSFGFHSQTPPRMNDSTVADLFFNSDETTLFQTVKGNQRNHRGQVSSYPLVDGVVSHQGVHSYPKGISVLFGGFVVPGTQDQIFVSDSGTSGAWVMSFGAQGHAKITGAGAATPAVEEGVCWAEYSPVTDSAWVTSPISDTLLEFDARTAALKSQTNITGNPNHGLLDLVTPGKFLYGLSTGFQNNSVAGVTVVDITAKPAKTVQYLRVPGTTRYSHGLAYWSS